MIDNRLDSLNDSVNTYVNRQTHISIKDKLKHKLYDLRSQGKLTSRLCPGKVYVWLKVNKHYQPSFGMKTASIAKRFALNN
ncbi:MAG: hypothetical protein ACTS43_00045 [Candidatus Hodgkinia cicadicola]